MDWGVVPGIVGWSWLMCDVKALDGRVLIYVTRNTLCRICMDDLSSVYGMKVSADI